MGKRALRTPEVAHEGHDEWPVAPALGERDIALTGLDRDLREGVSDPAFVFTLSEGKITQVDYRLDRTQALEAASLREKPRG